MILIRTAVALALALTTLVAAAQAASSPSSPAKKQLAAKLVKLQQPGIEAVANQIAVRTSQQIMGAVVRALERVPADKREAAAKDIEADVRKFNDEIAAQLRASAVKFAPEVIAPALEQRFTEDELKTIAAWLESPVSRKYEQFSAELGQTLAQKVITENRTTVEPKIKALEASIGKKLGASPDGAAASPPAPGAAASGAKK